MAKLWLPLSTIFSTVFGFATHNGIAEEGDVRIRSRKAREDPTSYIGMFGYN